MNFQDWFTPSIGIIGVAVGALLTPYVTSRMENAKIKKGIKPELIKVIYTFFNIRKTVIEFNSSIAVNDRTQSMIWNALTDENLPESIRKNFEKQYDLKIAERLRNAEVLNGYFKMIIESESHLFAILALIQIHYGNKKHKLFNSLLKPHIDDSNKPNTGKELLGMSAQELSAYEKNLSTNNALRYIDLDTKCEALINSVTRLL